MEIDNVFKRPSCSGKYTELLMNSSACTKERLSHSLGKTQKHFVPRRALCYHVTATFGIINNYTPSSTSFIYPLTG